MPDSSACEDSSGPEGTGHSPEAEGERMGLAETGLRREGKLASVVLAPVLIPSCPHLWDSYPEEAMADTLTSRKKFLLYFFSS